MINLMKYCFSIFFGGCNKPNLSTSCANLLKKINIQICLLNIFVFNLQLTYQERLRDGPYEVLATLKMKGAKSHSMFGGR